MAFVVLTNTGIALYEGGAYPRTRMQHERELLDVHVRQQSHTRPYYTSTEKELQDWVSLATSATEVASEISPSTYAGFGLLPTAVEDNADPNVNPSISSQEAVENGQTQCAIEEERAKAFSEQLGKYPATLFERFQRQYPTYRGTRERFMEGCAFIKYFHVNPPTLHPFMWDDFLYFTMVAKDGCSSTQCTRSPQCTHRLHGMPLVAGYHALFFSYHSLVPLPHYTSTIVNRRTLEDYALVDPECAERLRVVMVVAQDRARERHFARELDGILQRAIFDDMEGMDSA